MTGRYGIVQLDDGYWYVVDRHARDGDGLVLPGHHLTHAGAESAITALEELDAR